MLLPVPAGKPPAATFFVDAAIDTTLEVELRGCSRYGSYTPDRTLARLSVPLHRGANRPVLCGFDVAIDKPQYLYYCLKANRAVEVHLTDKRLSGVIACAYSGRMQRPPDGIGVETFEMWLPQRRPGGRNLALTLNPPLDLYAPANVANGVTRPTTAPNAWVADFADPRPKLTLTWDRPQTIASLVLGFDTDFDHPMESVLYGHPESEMPFTVKRHRVLDDAGNVLHEAAANHQTRNVVRLAKPVSTRALHIEALESWGAPAAIFEVRCYAS
jgi:hypothetical protein